MGIIINHDKDPKLNKRFFSMESKAGCFFFVAQVQVFWSPMFWYPMF